METMINEELLIIHENCWFLENFDHTALTSE